jgi:hypothetical protein
MFFNLPRRVAGGSNFATTTAHYLSDFPVFDRLWFRLIFKSMSHAKLIRASELISLTRGSIVPLSKVL